MTSPEQIRREMRQRREALSPEERYSLSRQIEGRLEQLPEYRAARLVMIYRAVKGEVRLDSLKGKDFAYPLCTGPGEMLALMPEDERAWKEGAFGIPEPLMERARLIAPEEIELVVCPCTAFDGSCSRLGMGGGYYDRYLPLCTGAKFVAVAYEFQRVDRLIRQDWDVPMDAVITESRVYRREGEQ